MRLSEQERQKRAEAEAATVLQQREATEKCVRRRAGGAHACVA
jgi:hypothetical protein